MTSTVYTAHTTTGMGGKCVLQRLCASTCKSCTCTCVFNIIRSTYFKGPSGDGNSIDMLIYTSSSQTQLPSKFPSSVMLHIIMQIAQGVHTHKHAYVHRQYVLAYLYITYNEYYLFTRCMYR